MKRLIIGSAVAAALVGCSLLTHQNHSGNGSHNSVTLEQKLSLLEVPSDVDFGDGTRDPASVNSLQGFDRHFFDIYQSRYEDVVKMIIEKAQDTRVEEPHKILGHYLDQLARVSYRTDLKIREFDRTLDQETIKPDLKKPAMVERTLYKQELVPLWIIRERIRHQVIHVLISLLMAESDQSQDAAAMSDSAKKVLDYTRSIWTKIADDSATGDYQGNNRVMRYVLQDLYRETAHGIANYAEAYTNTFSKPIPANLAEFLSLTKRIAIEDAKQLEALEAQVKAELNQAVQSEQAKLSSEKGKKPSWISLVQADTRKKLVVENEAKRTPQSARICPSATDSGGNVTGSNFPKGTWALTLDDGPNATHTETIRKAFDQNGVKGTFFWLAQLTAKSSNKSAIQNVKASGHTLANHSYSHANLPTLGSSSLKKEIVTATEMHTSVYGFKPKFFRCPYGACGKSGGTIRNMIADQDMVHMFWNVDSLDWKDKNAALLFDRVKKQVKAIDAKGSGGVILFHDIHETSAATMVLLSKWMKEQNYKVENIETIAQELNGNQACPSGWAP